MTGVSKSGFAGGIGVVAVPLMALEVGPIRAAAIMLPVLLVMDYWSLRAWWGQQHNGYLKLLLPGAMIGILAGYLLFDYLDDRVLTLLLGVFSIWFAIWGLIKGQNMGDIKSPWMGRICGTVAGLTSFFAHAGGPPFNLYMIPKKLPRETYVATGVVFFSVVNVVKLAPYAALGQVNIDNLFVAGILLPVAWLGVRLGLVVQSRINDQLYYRLILIMLFLVGVRLIFSGL